MTRAAGSMLTAVFLFNVPLVTAAFWGKRCLSMILFADPGFGVYAFLTILWVTALLFFDLSLAFLRALERIRKIALVRITYTIANLVMIVAVCSLKRDLLWIVILSIGLNYLFFAYVLASVALEKGLPMPNFSGWKTYLAFSLPLVPLGLLRWVVNASDRYFITHMLDLSQTGIYSVSYTLGTLISMFAFPIFYVLFPKVSKHWDEGNRSLVKKYLGYSTLFFLLVSIPATLLLYYLSQPLLAVVLSSEFVAGADLVLLISFSSIMMGLFQINVYIIYLMKKTSRMLLVFLAGAGINVAGNILLIPLMGIKGAAVSTLVSYATLCAMMTVWGKRELDYSLAGLPFLGKLALAATLMAFCLALFNVKSLFEITASGLLAMTAFAATLFALRIFTNNELRFFKETFMRSGSG